MAGYPRAPLNVALDDPLAVDGIVFCDERQRVMCSIAVKGTYRLLPDECALESRPSPIFFEDQPHEGGPAKGIARPSDVEPFKHAPEIVVVGSAYATNGPADHVLARVTVGEVDKSVDAWVPRRYRTEGTLESKGTATRFPLDYGSAAGGPGTDNPIGVSVERVDSKGRHRVPGLLPPKFALGGAGAFVPTVGLGPIEPRSPMRQRYLREEDHRWLEDPATLPQPAGFDDRYFQASAPDQWLSAPFSPDDWFVLESLHPRQARLATRLPGFEPRAFAYGKPLTLRAELVVIDSDLGVLTVTWRARCELDTSRNVVPLAVRTAQFTPAATPPPPQAPPAPAKPHPKRPTARIVRPPPPDGGFERTAMELPAAGPAGALPFASSGPMSRGAPRASLADGALPFRDSVGGSGRSPSPPPPPPVQTASALSPITANVPTSALTGGPMPPPPPVPTASAIPPPPPSRMGGLLGGSAPSAAVPPAAVPPAPLPPAPVGQGIVPGPIPSAKPPSVAPPAPVALAPMSASVSAPASMSSSSGLSGSGLSGSGLSSSGTIGSMGGLGGSSSGGLGLGPKPLGSSSGTLGQSVAASSLSSSLSSSSPLASSLASAPIAPPAPVTKKQERDDGSFGAAFGSLRSASLATPTKSDPGAAKNASDAAAERERAKDAPLRTQPQEEVPTLRRRYSIDLLGFEPPIAKRLRQRAPYSGILKATPFQRRPQGLDGTKEISDDERDRLDVLRVLSYGRPLDVGEARKAVQASFDDDLDLDPPLLMLAGEARPTFDELETLRATVAIVQPLGPNEKKVQTAVALASEALAANPPPTADKCSTITKQLEQASQSLSLPPRFVVSQVERTLLEQRKFKRRELWGTQRFRVDLVVGTETLPCYIDDARSAHWPLLPSVQIVVLGELRPREDASETSADAFVVRALGRVLAARQQ